MKKSLEMAIFTLLVTLAVSPMISVAADTGGGDGGKPPKPPKPQLAAKLVDGVGGAVGGAGYGSKTTKEGKTFSKLGVKLDKLTLAADTKLTIRVNDAIVGSTTVKVGPKGGVGAELVLDSAKGDKVPAVTEGTSIAAHLADGTPVASGKFQKPTKK